MADEIVAADISDYGTPNLVRQETMMDVVHAIENALCGNYMFNADGTVPTGHYIGKLLFSLKEFLEKKEHDLADEDKAFLEFAKSSANIYAIIFNAVNAFGTATSFSMHDTDSKNLASHKYMRVVFIAMTLAFIPFAVVAVGLAHALEHNKTLINQVVFLLCTEVIYMVVMGALFSYYLISDSVLVTLIVVGTAAIFVCGITVAVRSRRQLPWFSKIKVRAAMPGNNAADPPNPRFN